MVGSKKGKEGVEKNICDIRGKLPPPPTNEEFDTSNAEKVYKELF